jgi:hypothetical protein
MRFRTYSGRTHVNFQFSLHCLVMNNARSFVLVCKITTTCACFNRLPETSLYRVHTSVLPRTWHWQNYVPPQIMVPRINSNIGMESRSMTTKACCFPEAEKLRVRSQDPEYQDVNAMMLMNNTALCHQNLCNRTSVRDSLSARRCRSNLMT